MSKQNKLIQVSIVTAIALSKMRGSSLNLTKRAPTVRSKSNEC